MAYSYDFGDTLRSILNDQRRSGAWLAEQLNFDAETVNRWMRIGTRPQSPEVIHRIAEILKLDTATHKKLLIDADYAVDLSATIVETGRDSAQPSEPLSTPSDEHEVFFLRLPKKYRDEFRAFVKQRNLVALDSNFKPIIIVLIVAIVLALLSPVMVKTAQRIWHVLDNLSHEPTPTPTIIPTPEPTATRALIPTATSLSVIETVEATPVAIPSAAINIRSGPGTEYEILQATSAGDRLILIGKNPEGTWWQVLFNGISGWVLGELVAVQNANAVPVVVDYPPPPSTSTPEPTPTPPLPTATLTPSPTETATQQATEGTSGTRALASFSQIILSTPGNLLLVQEASSSITIDAPADVIPAIYTRVEGSTLSIGTTSPIQVSNGSIQYRLSTPNIDAITILGDATINIGALDTRSLVVNISGTGKITVSSGRVVEQNVRIVGAGSFSADNLNSDKAIIEIIGPGQATVWVHSQLEASANAGGAINYYGSPTKVTSTATNSSNIQSLGTK